MFVSAHAACELVGTAASGPDAVAAIRALSPDLVLLDVHLPGFSGIEALRAVRADASITQPEVVAVTAARDVDTVRDARLMGVRHYLVKPFTAHELHDRIDDVIAERGAAASGGHLDQSRIDAVMRPAARRSLPKGLTRETLDLVHAALVRLDGGTAADVAGELGLSRVSCRRYLEHLADEGAARRTMDYATAGRPSTRYLLAG
ncbi:response regulator [Microbacterium sp. EYE_5]|nr:response regulator [Microbacterium sp. EYE_382]MCK6086513.1 response regulator [Microbacterium sp. EYE_384]MCK6123989.1 response regulator [Microbacterium sp. EYE_80]MCK6126898.1 response regulator [Microbacterium sp. EYE_79]MCK6142198.1 response regulator [Microbacterium sp. EYE_39]MCK6218544.1 response regulator [Microbacterium sp. EYE_5]MCK6228698.1 response regulator [Microbacterium sp. EYE_77]MCK6247404.1 response regulator [Microbacterium sp. EYE_78]